MAAPELIRILADGRCHSGQRLAGQLGLSRTAVWKQIQRMQTLWGLPVEAIKGKGYRLGQPLDLLDKAQILRQLSPRATGLLQRLELFDEIDSTNSQLMARALSGDKRISACLAERQTAGRGRRGRCWLSPFAANLTFSLLWPSPRPPQQLGGLSLAVGVMVARRLRALGFASVGLKWPNDLLTPQGKLGGVLIQLSGEGEGPSNLVIGLGLNVRMPPGWGQDLDQPWVDLAALGHPPPRSTLAGLLLSDLLEGLSQYDSQGLQPFLADWPALDQLQGKPVRLLRGDDGLSQGICAGVAEDGALLLRTAEGLQRHHSGEVSLRGV
ncbi:biotin--[acetyl-CoA-carboxylase] ligase [Magnetovirga frankeli]|uniref:biotin--[acetyl-CoA-carboxylase] ligase n=1 Tax=Magnetovirga frankeli TaxID=947516 RepID=UPI001293A138|nr:biotin--[acetyl-CoA-carboxylase] ligase [gamma proteobacterium SS-5]